MKFPVLKVAFVITLLLVLIARAGAAAVLAGGGCGGASSTGKGFTCGASGSSSGTVTTVTTTTTTTTGGDGGGGGHKFKSGYSIGTGPITVGNPCSLASNFSWGSSCNIGRSTTVIHHHQGDSTTTTTQTFVICNNVIVTSANITCDTRWQLYAHVNYPAIPIDTRPYPATLNRYPTFLRVDGLTTAIGSGGLSYIAAGGGSPNNPMPGDWRRISLTLTLYPKTNKAEVYLEKLGWITLPAGQLYSFKWNLPSHPAAGGGPLAGAVGQLQELPQDMPLFTNYARSAYGLHCELTWEQYDRTCVLGPDANGNYGCDLNRGHNDYRWLPHSLGHEILPTEVKNLPPAQAADTNGDGIPDAFWDLGVIIRRMNAANDTSDPVYAHTYGWGDVWYWAAREAQGQITWP